MCCEFVEYCNVACLLAMCYIVACDVFAGRVPTSTPTLTFSAFAVCCLPFAVLMRRCACGPCVMFSQLLA
jgi:hypothetical protein